MGFTFYLKNEGNISVNVDVSMSITKATNYVDRATWIWLLKMKMIRMERFIVKDSINYNYPTEYNSYNYKNYIDDELIMHSTIVYFKPQEIKNIQLLFGLRVKIRTVLILETILLNLERFVSL